VVAHFSHQVEHGAQEYVQCYHCTSLLVVNRQAVLAALEEARMAWVMQKCKQ
jgi:hypothetical protein